jgi:flagellar biosynthesis protein FlhG
MSSYIGDQADGLRRLLGGQRIRILRLASARHGVGKTNCAINLAAALVEQGREVLIIDENDGAKNVADYLGQEPTRGLLDVVRGKSTLDQSIRRIEDISILPASSNLCELPRLSRDQRLRLSNAVTASGSTFDFVIIDTCAGLSSRMLSIPLRDQPEILVTACTASSITSTYAFIKAASTEYGKRRYHVLMTRMRDELHAQALFRNMAGAARQYLGIDVTLLGFIAADDQIKRAANLGVPLLKAFPDAPAAAMFRQTARTVCTWPQSASCTGINDLMHGIVRCHSNPTLSTEQEWATQQREHVHEKFPPHGNPRLVEEFVS